MADLPWQNLNLTDQIAEFFAADFPVGKGCAVPVGVGRGANRGDGLVGLWE